MANEKCFCHFNGYEVKDAKARQQITGHESRLTHTEFKIEELEILLTNTRSRLAALEGNSGGGSTSGGDSTTTNKSRIEPGTYVFNDVRTAPTTRLTAAIPFTAIINEYDGQVYKGTFVDLTVDTDTMMWGYATGTIPENPDKEMLDGLYFYMLSHPKGTLYIEYITVTAFTDVDTAFGEWFYANLTKVG